MQTLRRVRVIVISVLCTLCLACKKEPPPAVHIPTLALTAIDASCTEAWLKLTTTQLPATVRLVRLTPTLQTLQTLQLSTPDTLLIDEGLLPRRTYTYKAYTLEVRGSGFQVVDSSTQATVTTMDTTSHNFTWQIDTLGDGGGSVLYDVAIINDTLAYAVGEIYKRDSVGNWDPNAYNLVKWNGQRWQLLRIQFYTFCGQAGTGSYPAKSIFAFGPDDIWIGMNGSQVVRWNGQTQSSPECTPVSINKLWGENPNSIWAVGNNGQIAHYDGVRWRRIESGTELPMNDVWGGSNPIVGEQVALVTASLKYNLSEKKLIRVRQSGGIDSLPWPMQDRRVHSIWFDRNSSVYVSGGGIFRMNRSRRWVEQPVPLYYTNRIRGNAENDIVAVGDFGITAHFNGVSWEHFPEARLNGIYESVSFRGNLVIAVGWGGGRAFILHGTRR